MKAIIDRLCGLAVNTLDLHQLLDAGGLDTLQAAEGVEQQLALARADTGDFLEARFLSFLGARLSVPRDRKTMRLVTNLLDQE